MSEHMPILGNIAVALGASIIQAPTVAVSSGSIELYSNGSYSESLVYPLIMVRAVSYSNSTGASTSEVGQHWLHLPLHGTLHSKQQEELSAAFVEIERVNFPSQSLNKEGIIIFL